MRASAVIRMHQAVENPFTDRTKGFQKIHCGHLIIRGDKGSQKDGFVMKRFCVLLFENEQRAGYILCAKTKNQWDAFERAHSELFTQNASVRWTELQNDEIWTDFRVIALKDAHIDNTTLPEEQKESFLACSNEIFVKRTDETALSSTFNATSAELDGHYLIFESDEDFIEWIGHMQKISKIEQKAMEFRMNLVRRSSINLEVAPLQSPTKIPTKDPTKHPSKTPTGRPSKQPTPSPANKPSVSPTEAPTIDGKIRRKNNKWKKIMIGLALSFIVSGVWYHSYQLRLSAVKEQEEKLRELEELRILKESEQLKFQSIDQVMLVIDEWSDYIYLNFKLYFQIGAAGAISMASLMLILYIKSFGWILIPIAVLLMILAFVWNALPKYAFIVICALTFIIVWYIKCGCCKKKKKRKRKKKKKGRLTSSYWLCTLA